MRKARHPARHWASSRGRSTRTALGQASPARGFTLIELMVVVLIIGLLSTAVVLSVGLSGRDRELETEGERAASLINYAREKAELQTRELGLAIRESDYEFLTYDPRRSIWRRVDEDDALRHRALPEGLTMRLVVEGREVVLRRPEPETRKTKEEQEKEDRERVPHVMIFSNGDLTPFQLTVQREDMGRSITVARNEKGLIEAQPLQEGRP